MTRRQVGGLLLSLATGAARYEFTRPHMGTRFRIVLYAPDAQAGAAAAAADAFARVARLDANFSDYRDDSELMALCRGAGGPAVRVSDDLFRILSEAQRIARLTGGAFDVTAGPVVQLWRRARRTRAVPEAKRLQASRALVGFQKMHLDVGTRTVRLETPGMLLDLGGIAKGFAAEEAIAVLRRHGCPSALVAAGGDIVAGDAPPGRDSWPIEVAGVERVSLPLRRAAVSTSGDAEQHVEIGGVRYSHIVNPRTGAAATGRGSVTAVAPTGTLADALATAANVLGPRRGLKLVDSLDGVAAMFVETTAAGVKLLPSRRWNCWR